MQTLQDFEANSTVGAEKLTEFPIVTTNGNMDFFAFSVDILHPRK